MPTSLRRPLGPLQQPLPAAVAGHLFVARLADVPAAARWVAVGLPRFLPAVPQETAAAAHQHEETQLGRHLLARLPVPLLMQHRQVVHLGLTGRHQTHQARGVGRRQRAHL